MGNAYYQSDVNAVIYWNWLTKYEMNYILTNIRLHSNLRYPGDKLSFIKNGIKKNIHKGKKVGKKEVQNSNPLSTTQFENNFYKKNISMKMIKNLASLGFVDSDITTRLLSRLNTSSSKNTTSLNPHHLTSENWQSFCRKFKVQSKKEIEHLRLQVYKAKVKSKERNVSLNARRITPVHLTQNIRSMERGSRDSSHLVITKSELRLIAKKMNVSYITLLTRANNIKIKLEE